MKRTVVRWCWLGFYWVVYLGFEGFSGGLMVLFSFLCGILVYTGWPKKVLTGPFFRFTPRPCTPPKHRVLSLGRAKKRTKT